VQAGKHGDRALHVIDVPPGIGTASGAWKKIFSRPVKSKGRVHPHPNFEDGIRYMRVVQAVADSRARNEWVAIKP